MEAFPLLLSETLRERVAVGIALSGVKDLALPQLLSLTKAIASLLCPLFLHPLDKCAITLTSHE
jgi:hypothetical protein